MSKFLVTVAGSLICLLLLVECQNFTGCDCGNSSSSSTWGTMMEVGTCEGQCDVARRNLSRNCINPNNVSIICDFVMSCTNELSCDGTWSSWGNMGNCNSSCGPGFQRQTRTCYDTLEMQEGRYIVVRYCLKGKGITSQERIVSCTKRCPPPTMPVNTATITNSTTPTKTITTAAAANSINDTLVAVGNANLEIEDNNEIDGLMNSEALNNDQTNGVDVLTLSVALSSVAVLCVIAVIIVLIVVKRKKITKPNSNNSSKQVQLDNESGHYEMIGPMVPPVRYTNDSPVHMTASNLLYNYNPPDSAYYSIQSGKTMDNEFLSLPRGNNMNNEFRSLPRCNTMDNEFRSLPRGTSNDNEFRSLRRGTNTGEYLQAVPSSSVTLIPNDEDLLTNSPYACIDGYMH